MTTPQYRAIAQALQATSASGSGTGRPSLDGCGPTGKPALDGATVNAAAATYAQQNIRVQAASAVQVWADAEESPPLGAGEGACDRLVAMLIGIADADQSGELDENEQAIYLDAARAAWDYMVDKGISEDDLDTMFNSDDPDEANAAGERIISVLVDSLPSGEDESLGDMDDFAFGDPNVTLSAFDAAYGKKIAIKHGKKVTVRKRISGTVHRTPAQRAATRKMQTKSHGAKANMARKKSMKVRRSVGM
jgi:hypothetical protein